MVQYDTIRVVGEGIAVKIHEYHSKGKHGHHYLHFGKWKKDRGYIVPDRTWGEPELFREYIAEMGIKINARVSRLDLCRDSKVEGAESLIKKLSWGYNSLPVVYQKFWSNHNLVSVSYKNQDWICYHKHRKNGVFQRNIIRFEYRMKFSRIIDEVIGHDVYLQDLVQLDHYHTLEDTFFFKWEEILEQCQFLEKDTDFSNEIERAMSFSRIKNNHIDFKIVERIILGKYLREAFGKDWYKVLDQEDPVDKRRLMCWKRNIENTIKQYYDWQQEVGVEETTDVKDHILKILGTEKGH